LPLLATGGAEGTAWLATAAVTLMQLLVVAATIGGTWLGVTRSTINSKCFKKLMPKKEI
jgi:hypothetical protein